MTGQIERAARMGLSCALYGGDLPVGKLVERLVAWPAGRAVDPGTRGSSETSRWSQVRASNSGVLPGG